MNEKMINVIKYLQVDVTTAILISFGSVIVYLAWRLYKTGIDSLDLLDTIAVFLSSYSLLGGLRVIIFGIENKICHLGPTEQTYIVIGGGAVIWNSCRTLRKKLKEIYKSAYIEKGESPSTAPLAET